MRGGRTGERRGGGGRWARAAGAAACAALLLAALGATGAAGAGEPGPGRERGSLVSAQLLYTLTTPRRAAGVLTAAGFDGSSARYGVDAFQLVYRTTDPRGRATTASGLLVLPRGAEGPLHAVSFTHGTESHKPGAPSTSPRDFAAAPALAHAAAGFAGVAPDYLGLGLGPGPHPWMDIASEITASLDMLRAAQEFTREHTGHPLRREVLLTGFSQGAPAALGLGRALQAGADPYFRLGALAPISGAYDLRGAELPALLGGELDAKASVFYAAFALVSFNRLHPLYDDPEEVFRPPYDVTIEDLLDGTHPGEEVAAGTPGSVDRLLTWYGRELLAHPTGALAEALRASDAVCADWAPRAPVRLYQATGDEQVTVANTAHCRDAFAAHGVTAPVIDVAPDRHEGSPHLGSCVAATARIVAWFSELTGRD